jgi:hypothetical protein
LDGPPPDPTELELIADDAASTRRLCATGYAVRSSGAGTRANLPTSRCDMKDERAIPKPQPQRPIVVNPSTPGVQKPNRPDGRDDPPQGERRG